jgi:serine/threonine protein kinase, bacterial
MPHPLLDRAAIDVPPETFLRGAGDVFAVFARDQDSGNHSYGVAVAGERFFVKSAGPPGAPHPVLAHADRVALLRNAARLHATFRHPLLPPLRHVIESPHGPLLVYDWAEGELLYNRGDRRDDPASAFRRFCTLPTERILASLDAIFELHARLAEAGWVAADFYDGCLIYDFARDRLAVIDLDTYHQGPFVNTMGRMFGSSRFMAPEEFERGAPIDERTSVFTMGRAALVFLANGQRTPETFRGPPALYEIVARATEPDRSARFDSLAAFYAAWRAARG